MKKFNNRYMDVAYLSYRWLSAFIDPLKLTQAFPNIIKYMMDLRTYSQMKNAEPIKLIDTNPRTFERTSETDFDHHYFYQSVWAYKKIYASKTKIHYDIASDVFFVGLLTAIKKVIFIDIRPLKAKLNNFESVKASILNLPYRNNSISSISCLHVVEHIGLGRYRDKLDPLGSKKACHELVRILKSGGNLYLSVPIGKPRLCFNSHRVHSLKQIIKYFKGLKLIELSAIDDAGNFITNVNVNILEKSDSACGLFHFTKKSKN